jgi:hypothetical protein
MNVFSYVLALICTGTHRSGTVCRLRRHVALPGIVQWADRRSDFSGLLRRCVTRTHAGRFGEQPCARSGRVLHQEWRGGVDASVWRCQSTDRNADATGHGVQSWLEWQSHDGVGPDASGRRREGRIGRTSESLLETISDYLPTTVFLRSVTPSTWPAPRSTAFQPPRRRPLSSDAVRVGGRMVDGREKARGSTRSANTG